MFAIAYDLVVADTEKYHPKGVSQAYIEIGTTLAQFNFKWVQGSLYISDNEDMSELFGAIDALKNKEWFKLSVRDIRAFKIEQWSNFTNRIKN
ncbi:MAG: putative virulence-associated protein [Pseudomonadota bacterium]|jgi:virulence-associated protein VapD